MPPTGERPSPRDPSPEGTEADRRAGPLQTLDRGLTALALVAGASPAGLSVPDLAERLGVHRTIAYRIAATLEAHGMVVRDASGLLRLGAGLVAVAARFEAQVRALAQPVLDRLAEETRAAAFLSVPQGEACFALLVAEPQTTLLRVAYRIGSRHPLTRGAAGIAILAGRPARADDAEAVRRARAEGVSLTRGQLQAGAIGVACPLRAPGDRDAAFEGSVGVVTLGEADEAALTAAVTRAARELRGLLAGGGE